MTDKKSNDITFEIMEHIGTIDVIDGRDEKWTKEINVVAWNGGKPKIDVRDWNSSHDRMSRGITLTEEQAMKMPRLSWTATDPEPIRSTQLQLP